MTKSLLLLLFLLLAVAAVAGAAATIHDLLRAHGLPGGLLPRAVANYSMDESTGLIEARLDRPCYAKYLGDRALFNSVVRGNLSFGALRGLEGLSQEELFVWLPVKGILVADPASGVILFDIGIAHKQLPRSAFEDPPDCQPTASKALDDAAAADHIAAAEADDAEHVVVGGGIIKVGVEEEGGGRQRVLAQATKKKW